MNGDFKFHDADFLTAMKLKKAVVGAIKESGVDIARIDINNLNMGSIDAIGQMILAADSSEKVEKALFVCLERCLYNGEKVTAETFEPVEARKDYYEIIIECLKGNLGPFFEPLFLRLKKLLEQPKISIQK